MKKFTSDYICHDCGTKYSKPRNGVSTVHQGTCGICGKETGVSHQRNYNWFLEKEGWIFEENNEKNKMKIKLAYNCKCGESIKQVYANEKDNIHWLKNILAFYYKHNRHGFEL